MLKGYGHTIKSNHVTAVNNLPAIIRDAVKHRGCILHPHCLRSGTSNGQ